MNSSLTAIPAIANSIDFPSRLMVEVLAEGVTEVSY